MVKNKLTISSADKDEKKLALIFLVEYKTVQLLWKAVFQLLIKINIP